MNPTADPNKAREVFVAALRTTADHREAYVAAACGAHEALRQRVKALLAAHDQAGSFLDAPAAGIADVEMGVTSDQPAPALGEEPGAVVGRYKLLERIGEGGF